MEKNNEIFELYQGGEENHKELTKNNLQEIDEALYLLDNGMLDIEIDDSKYSDAYDEDYFDDEVL